MLDHNHKNNGNGSCGFAAEMVSYMYDDLSAVEKNKFAEHLRGCNACSAELAGVSEARVALLDWRREEFLPLAAPVITLPQTELKPLKTAQPEASWLDRLRELFTVQPMLTAGAAGFAALAVGAMIAWTVFNGSTGSGNEKYVAINQPQASPAPVANSTTPNESVEIARNDNSKPPTDANADASSDQALKAEINKKAQKINPVNASVSPGASVPKAKVEPDVYRPEPQKANQRPDRKGDAKKPKKEDLKDLPAEDDIYTDQTLRLADLFEEIDSAKS